MVSIYRPSLMSRVLNPGIGADWCIPVFDICKENVNWTLLAVLILFYALSQKKVQVCVSVCAHVFVHACFLCVGAPPSTPLTESYLPSCAPNFPRDLNHSSRKMTAGRRGAGAWLSPVTSPPSFPPLLLSSLSGWND